ncbi:pyruvate dehydrogenase complex dihydrolipoamide acetyltransferase [Rickettsia endosymbiont of Polydrusus tereticollis]|uniref:pyruvate dehydrogenase complex dihydrolipoamide acetyltransferase n=1 Tax=Rickettsia endosymbiont of Polydrusus tereticollis TaxID=3066251 RepID=UPI003132E7FA
MPIKILMPALSPTMLEGNIARWLKKEGDKINPGEVIAEIETDKATMEVEAVDEGILAKILIAEGTENVPVNSLIAVLIEEGEDISVVADFVKNNSTVKLVEKSPPPLSNNVAVPPIEVAENGNNSKVYSNDSSNQKSIFASPLARRLAAIDNINLKNVKGSGPHGRIIKRDVLEASNISVKANDKAIRRNSEEYYLVPNNNIRKIIAKRLLESKQTIPHFYLSIECNVDKLLDIREDINKSFGDDKSQKISVNDFIILAVGKALKEVPRANASWQDEAIKYYNNIDISVAVAIEGGLITPVIRNADQKNIIDLSREMKELIKKARENKLTPAEFQGGGFSISNLGMYGIKNFSAIINPPQSCIIGVGASSKRPIIVNNQVTIATIMDVTLSSDHRVVDGAVGAEFLAAFKKFVESPALMLISCG